MSNYTVTTNFGAKDGLVSGNPAKLILGSQFTTEFNNIATAVATKVDNSAYVQTAAEISAGVTPTSTAYPPGDIRRYGAVSGTDCASIVSLAATCNKTVTIPVGTWPIAATPTIPAGVQVVAVNGAAVSGAGAGTIGLSTNVLFQSTESTTNNNDIASNYFFRNANHTAGTPGFVSSALRAKTSVSSGCTNYEWTLVGVIDNSSTAGQNVGGYFQGNKLSTGPTWGAVAEVQEKSAVNNPSTGQIGLEVDCRSNGTDLNGNRVGIDVVCTRYNNSGPATTTGFGVRVQNNNDGANSLIANAFSAYNCNVVVAFDCAYATVTSGAMRMAQGQPILFDVNGTNKLASNGLGLDHSVSGTLKNRLLATGGLQVNSAQVVGPTITGWGASTNGARGPINGSTATLAQTSAALAQLILDLQTHGLLGG